MLDAIGLGWCRRPQRRDTPPTRPAVKLGGTEYVMAPTAPAAPISRADIRHVQPQRGGVLKTLLLLGAVLATTPLAWMGTVLPGARADSVSALSDEWDKATLDLLASTGPEGLKWSSEGGPVDTDLWDSEGHSGNTNQKRQLQERPSSSASPPPSIPPSPTSSSPLSSTPTPGSQAVWDADLVRLNEGLVDYWPLQMVPNSIKGRGAVSGTIGYDQSGLLGGAGVFSGASYIYGSSNGFPQSDRTLIFNFFPTAYEGKWKFFAYGGVDNSCGASFRVFYDSGRFGIHRHCGDNTPVWSSAIDVATIMNRWNQLAIVTGTTGTTMYLNGRSIVDSSAGYALYYGTQVEGKRFCIGADVLADGNACYGPFFPGKLSDVRLWERRLRTTEVKEVGCFDQNHSGGKLSMEGGCDPFPEEFITEPLYPSESATSATLPRLARHYPFKGDTLDYGPFHHPLIPLGEGLTYTDDGAHVMASTLLRANAADIDAFERTVVMAFKADGISSDKSAWLFSINGFEYPTTCGRGYSILYGYPNNDALLFGRACDAGNLYTASHPRAYFSGMTHMVATTSRLGRTRLYLNGQRVASRIQFPVSMATGDYEYLTPLWGATREGVLYTAESNLVPISGTLRELTLLNGAVSTTQAYEIWNRFLNPEVSPSALPTPSEPPVCPPVPNPSVCPTQEVVVIERFVNQTIEVCSASLPNHDLQSDGTPIWVFVIVGVAPATLLSFCVYMVMQRKLKVLVNRRVNDLETARTMLALALGSRSDVYRVGPSLNNDDLAATSSGSRDHSHSAYPPPAAPPATEVQSSNSTFPL